MEKSSACKLSTHFLNHSVRRGSSGGVCVITCALLSVSHPSVRLDTSEVVFVVRLQHDAHSVMCQLTSFESVQPRGVLIHKARLAYDTGYYM